MMSNYKYCAVPLCINSSRNSNKIFVGIPNNEDRRKKWFKAMKRKNELSTKTTGFVCEDHFNLQEDAENWTKYSMVRCNLRMKNDVVPHKFACQNRPDNLLNTNLELSAAESSRSVYIKRRRVETVRQSLMEADLAPTEEIQSEELEESPKQSKYCQSKPETRTVGIQRNPPVSVNAATSPMKLFCIEKTEENISSDSYSSTTEEESECDGSESYFGSSSSDMESDKEICTQRAKYTLHLMEKKPRLYLGIDCENYFIINLLSVRTGLPVLAIMVMFRKIRLNESFQILAQEFNVSPSTVARYFSGSIIPVASNLRELVFWVDKKKVLLNLPIPFRIRYSHVVSIIDCLEIEIEKPSNPIWQSLTWSEYKKTNTIKYLISSTPDGYVNFISRGYGGRATDSVILKDSGFLEQIPGGCGVMADRGFKQTAHLFSGKNCDLIRPPSVSKSAQSSKEEVKLTKQIASLRIHIERVIRRVREYKFLLPHSCIDNHLVKKTDFVMQIVCGLINLQNKLIK